MLPRIDTNRLLVTEVQAPSAIVAIDATKQEVLSKLSQLVVGKQLFGEITSKLNDGTFLVRLLNTTVRLTLPTNLNTGDKVTLKLTSLTPNPTFSLVQHGSDMQEFNSTMDGTLVKANVELSKKDNGASMIENTPTSLQRSTLHSTENKSIHLTIDSISTGKNIVSAPNLLNTSLEQKLMTNSTPTNFSNAAQLLSRISQENTAKNAPKAITSLHTLLNIQDIDKPPAVLVKQLSQSLHTIVSTSGLFYESHVANWVKGKHSLEDLKREPQSLTANSSPLEISNDPSTSLPTDLTKLIQLQIATLEEQKIAWQGAFTPEIPMTWHISHQENTPKEPLSDGQENKLWQSVLHLELPTLGKITATIHLQNNNVQLHLKTDLIKTSKHLNNQYPVLAESLNIVNAKIESFTVNLVDTNNNE